MTAAIGSSLLSSIYRDGYAILANALPVQSTFDELYSAFDIAVQSLEQKVLVSSLVEKISEAWAADSRLSAYYARAPMGFRNRAVRIDKDRKQYFQYCREFGGFVKTRFPALLSEYPEFSLLFSLSDALWELSGRTLRAVILHIAESGKFEGLSKVLVRREREFPLLLRLIRYDPGPKLATAPHLDKSAFTLHLNSDDKSGDRFLIGPGGRDLVSLADLRPAQIRRAGGATDAIVFPGLFLNTAGYDALPATPHAALGMEEQTYRHSLVSFWLVPYLISDHLDTNIRGVA